MPYICDRCSLFCNDLGMLNVHMRSHTNEKPFACPKCGREFAQKGNLGAHMRTHAEVKPFVCDQCSKQFAIRKTLDRHIVRCHPESASHIADLEKILKADAIRNARRRLKRLRVSAINGVDTSVLTLPVINEMDLVFKCERCDRQFNNATKLQSHMVVHDGTKPYMCKICNKGFTQVGTLNSHIRFIHQGERPYGCPTCSKRFANKSHMKLHINTHIKQGALKCRTCYKSFSKMEHLMHHLCLQSGDKLFSCATCNKNFSSTGELCLHARIHVADGVNFKCNHCRQIFSSKQSLLTHSIQYNSKKHICPICNSNHCDVRSLSRHMQSHLDTNSNSCPICNRTYNRRNNLKSHLKVHISQINEAEQIKNSSINEKINGYTLTDLNETENGLSIHSESNEIVSSKNVNRINSDDIEIENVNVTNLKSKINFINILNVKSKSLKNSLLNNEISEQITNCEINILNDDFNGKVIDETNLNILTEIALIDGLGYLKGELNLNKHVDYISKKFENIMNNDNSEVNAIYDTNSLNNEESDSIKEQSNNNDVFKCKKKFERVNTRSKSKILNTRHTISYKKSYIKSSRKTFNKNYINNHSLKSSNDLHKESNSKRFKRIPGIESQGYEMTIIQNVEKTFCYICDKDYGSKCNLIKHGQKSHNSLGHTCMECGAVLSSFIRFNSHLCLHRKKQCYCCAICKKKFDNFSLLESHTRAHTGDRPFSCKICGKSYSQQSTISVHMRTVHQGDKPFKCSMCDRKFARFGHLKRHTMMHTGYRPYTCNVCSKQFIEKSKLKTHRAKEHKIGPDSDKELEYFPQMALNTLNDSKNISCSNNENSYLNGSNVEGYLQRNSDTDSYFSEVEINNRKYHISTDNLNSKPKDELNGIRIEKPSLDNLYNANKLFLIDKTNIKVEDKMKHSLDDDFNQIPLSDDNKSINLNTTDCNKGEDMFCIIDNNDGISEVSNKNNDLDNTAKIEHFEFKYLTDKNGAIRKRGRPKGSKNKSKNFIDENPVADVKANENDLKVTESEVGKLIYKHICPTCKRGFIRMVPFQKHVKVCTDTLNMFHLQPNAQTEPSIDCVPKLAKTNLPEILEVQISSSNDNDNEKVDKAKETLLYSCNRCQRRFTSLASLQRHISFRHNREKKSVNTVCVVCNKKFTCASVLQSHMYSHTGQKPFSCLLCSSKFTQASSLRVHVIVIHGKSKAHTCAICDRKFARRSHLNRHLRMHTGDKRFKCEKCDRTFLERSKLNIHAKVHDKEDRPMQFKVIKISDLTCKFCNKEFLRHSYLVKHLQLHGIGRPYFCDRCSKQYRQKSTLVAHMRSHTGERPFICDMCTKSFTSKSCLNKHRRSHTGDRPYECRYCELKYRKSSSLRTHLIKAHGSEALEDAAREKRRKIEALIASGGADERPWVCLLCQKSFTHVSLLNIHMRVHSKEKPFSCPECGKCFSQQGSMKSHLRYIHCGDKPYPCRFCTEQFMSRKSLNRHMQVIHPNETLPEKRCKIVDLLTRNLEGKNPDLMKDDLSVDKTKLVNEITTDIENNWLEGLAALDHAIQNQVKYTSIQCDKAVLINGINAPKSTEYVVNSIHEPLSKKIIENYQKDSNDVCLNITNNDNCVDATKSDMHSLNFEEISEQGSCSENDANISNDNHQPIGSLQEGLTNLQSRINGATIDGVNFQLDGHGGLLLPQGYVTDNAVRAVTDSILVNLLTTNLQTNNRYELVQNLTSTQQIFESMNRSTKNLKSVNTPTITEAASNIIHNPNYIYQQLSQEGKQIVVAPSVKPVMSYQLAYVPIELANHLSNIINRNNFGTNNLNLINIQSAHLNQNDLIFNDNQNLNILLTAASSSKVETQLVTNFSQNTNTHINSVLNEIVSLSLSISNICSVKETVNNTTNLLTMSKNSFKHISSD